MPGFNCRCKSPWRAVAVSRGSTMIQRPPLSRCCQRNLLSTGKVSAQFDPAINKTSARGISLHGFAARSMPKALLFPAAAETMHNRPL